MATVERSQLEGDGHGHLSRDLARAMVALYKEYIGRGPGNARAYIEGDLITVVLTESMTRAEETLAREGEKDLVRDVRRVLKTKFHGDAVQIVEDLTGRRVRAFLSDHSVETDVAIEAFVLEPQGE